MNVWRALLDSCIALLVIATGFSSAFFSGPNAASGSSSMITVSLVGSFLMLAAFLVLSWRRTVGIVQVYAVMMIVALLGILLYAMGSFDGALPTFGLGPLFIGLMLANMPFKRATVVIIIGFGCSALVYPLFHLFSNLSNATIAQIVSIAFSIAATAFILLNGKTTVDWLPVKDTWNDHKAQRFPLLPLGTQKAFVAIFLAALVLFFASFGMYEVFAEQEGLGYSYLDSSLVPVAVSMMVLLAVAVKLDFRTWAGAAFGLAWIAFVASLFLTLVIADAFPVVFSVLGTVMVVVHIVVWLVVLSAARSSHISPLFLFAVVTATMKLAQHVGRLASDVLIVQTGASMQTMSTVAACFLAVASIVAGALVFAGFRAVGTPTPVEAQGPAPTRSATADAETAWARAFEEVCRAHDFSPRETEIISLYCQGRSAAAISEHMHLAEPTVRTYIRRAYAKLDVHNKQELFDIVGKGGSQA
ncbi:helix-turn-helix transcriptional regulator [Eggerthella sinensis]|uniref:helix-turn-helix transcriptional regulator n=1 Tax=Eggerthella sinensis TaxID=242230 RepID=UPI0022E74DB4|nr:helix-turn-helix transcriptional regulator [Eggerthella sinensis]